MQTHKLFGIVSGYPSSEIVREERDGFVSVAKNRQHDSGSLHKQSRGDGISRAGSPNSRSLDVVPREKHTHTGEAPPRRAQFDRRQGIEVHEGSVGLETRQGHLRQDRPTIWSTGSGPIRFQTDTPVPTLLQLAARSLRGSYRCLSTELGSREGVCQPTVELSFERPGADPESTSHSDLSGSSMESAAVVSTPVRDADREATPSSTSGRRVGSGRTPVGRVEHLRKNLRDQHLSVQATELILKSWRVKTNKSYDSLFGRWDRWCSERGSDPISGPVSEVANFLASLYGEGYQYNSVNAYRSAISSTHDRVDGVDVGQHPIITRLLKGVYNSRPPIPRYSSTWDVQTVLNHIETLGPTANLSLKALTLKTVFLLAITRPSRSTDLSSLDVSGIQSRSDGLSFIPNSLAKQSRQGKSIEAFFFPSFPTNINLCPVSTLRVYREKTTPLRHGETRVFISFIKPHKAVTSSTIARWLRVTLEEAGINSSIFGAYSTRGASASAASGAHKRKECSAAI